MVPQWLLNGLASESDGLLKPDVCRGAADLDEVLTRQYVPLALALVAVEAELLGLELHINGLALTRLQRHTGKAL